MKIINKSKNSPEPVIGFSESLLILGVILCILGYPIIFKHQEPQAPLFISFVLLAVYGRIRGFKWDTIMNGMRHGLRAGVDPPHYLSFYRCLNCYLDFLGNYSNNYVLWV